MIDDSKDGPVYGKPNWKARVEKSRTHEMWYVSRRRKHKAPEYLWPTGEWKRYAAYYNSEQEALTALDLTKEKEIHAEPRRDSCT